MTVDELRHEVARALDGVMGAAASPIGRVSISRLTEAVMTKIEPLAAFHERALGLREAVATLSQYRLGAKDDHTRAVLDGSSAAMDDLFNHPDTPESLRLPNLVTEDSEVSR